VKITKRITNKKTGAGHYERVRLTAVEVKRITAKLSKGNGARTPGFTPVELR